ncbi:hypothetical protein AB0M34_07315 [Nocardia sp. NPDC050193]
MILAEEPLLHAPHLYIDGAWVEPAVGGIREIRDPPDGAVIAAVGEVGAVDARRAVAAARTAFAAGEWPNAPGRGAGRTTASRDFRSVAGGRPARGRRNLSMPNVRALARILPQRLWIPGERNSGQWCGVSYFRR